MVYAKRPFAGPAAVLAYLSRYTHRVAISSHRFIALDQHGVSFRWKDYRAKGKTRHKTMAFSADEFMRRILLPEAFHRICHYGLLANSGPQCVAMAVKIASPRRERNKLQQQHWCDQQGCRLSLTRHEQLRA